MQGDYAGALEQYRKSLEIREESGNRLGISDTLSSIGDVLQAQGNPTQALQFAERAIDLAQRLGVPDLLQQALTTEGKAYVALGQPGRARQSFDAAIASVETMRAQIAGGEQEQQYFFASKISPYYAMVELLIAQNNPDEALNYAERAKARVLLDVLSSGRVNITKAMTREEQEQERHLNGQLVAFNSQLYREKLRPHPDPTRLAALEEQLRRARLDFEAFQVNLYAAHPELKARRGEAPVIKAEDLAALLPDPRSALLEYVVTDDHTYLFAITKAASEAGVEVRVYALPIKRADLTKQIESFRGQLARRDLGVRAPAGRLYQLLLKPAEAQLQGKTNLIIVPDDKLWELPFQGLITGDDRYVIETSAVSYSPSLTVLREMKAQRNKHWVNEAGLTLLALGNPAIGQDTRERAALSLRGAQLVPLPEAEQEVKALGPLYGAAHSKIYIGPEAREDRVKTEAGQADVLHFATHGILNDAAPMYSHLVLARGNKNEDGLLEAWELMRLDLKARLAVLSACETARGRFGAGEGVIGLSWAMFVAGVPTTLVSQWKVESTSTRDLMINFHRQLKAPSAAAGATVMAEAWRQAALKLMKNPATSHPFYWAGFVLVGDDR
jgi:CHAT domain-containing protein